MIWEFHFRVGKRILQNMLLKGCLGRWRLSTQGGLATESPSAASLSAPPSSPGLLCGCAVCSLYPIRPCESRADRENEWAPLAGACSFHSFLEGWGPSSLPGEGPSRGLGLTVPSAPRSP